MEDEESVSASIKKIKTVQMIMPSADSSSPDTTPTNHHHQFSKALKFTLYTYRSSSIGQSMLALALLDLKRSKFT